MSFVKNCQIYKIIISCAIKSLFFQRFVGFCQLKKGRLSFESGPFLWVCVMVWAGPSGRLWLQ